MDEIKSLLYIIAMELDMANTIAILNLPDEVAGNTERMNILYGSAKKIKDGFRRITIEDNT